MHLNISHQMYNSINKWKTVWFFFSIWAAFFRLCDLQGCLGHWSSQPLPLLSASYTCKEELVLSREIPRQERDLMSCPSTHTLLSPPLSPSLCISIFHGCGWVQASHQTLSLTAKLSSALTAPLLSSAVILDLSGHEKILTCKAVNCLQFTCLRWWKKPEYSAYDTSF